MTLETARTSLREYLALSAAKLDREAPPRVIRVRSNVSRAGTMISAELSIPVSLPVSTTLPPDSRAGCWLPKDSPRPAGPTFWLLASTNPRHASGNVRERHSVGASKHSDG